MFQLKLSIKIKKNMTTGNDAIQSGQHEEHHHQRHRSYSSASSTKDTGPSSPTPSISCETCAQMSQLELEAFAAVREVAPYVRSISVSEMLTRTPELLFLNLVTLENESYCIELTQMGWRICSDRLDCMNGDFRKLDMHVRYYDTIYALLDNLSRLYRDEFSNALAHRLNQLQNEQPERRGIGIGTARRERAATAVSAERRASLKGAGTAANRRRGSTCNSATLSRHHSSNEMDYQIPASMPMPPMMPMATKAKSKSNDSSSQLGQSQSGTDITSENNEEAQQ